ncbi:radical SAM protein [Schwartzia succinivorans]|uniref:4Fe-4S single cluster domain-containing protein n=1 Tax=Schwartzia succinivorans DSM 10502 TaxID=1123243 RepID=A0A1M4XDU6_9FIRM|nr:radical SAM protein [Schwartzia succinivorans]SHE91613.1 4Fe-4S single cluster domain-containing protein [Schwartzia succinivorans DSM 10502]
MKNIFYFNITYGCNSNCVFCYSHNTKHDGISHHDLSVETMMSYLKKNNIKEYDRIIINGGEPLLHPDIIRMIQNLKDFNCEILIYTNGRLLEKLPLNIFNDNFRIIIPWHGAEKAHDMVTGINGSYHETMRGINHMLNGCAHIELKIIVNRNMVSKRDIESSIVALDHIPIKSFHSVHLTKVDDTIISKLNKYPHISHADAAMPTLNFFNYCASRVNSIKIFDTCVASMPLPTNELPALKEEYAVIFKDWDHNWQIPLKEKHPHCLMNCSHKSYCISAVNHYTALEYKSGNWREFWE